MKQNLSFIQNKDTAQGVIEKPFFTDVKKPLGKESIAQGAIEYLLIIVAAIVVVAIVVIFISGFTNTANQGSEESQNTIIDSFTNWGNMLGGNNQGTIPPAPTTCAELGSSGTLEIGDKTVFCDNDGKMWTPTSENTITWTTAGQNYCLELSYAGFDDWRLPYIEEHRVFRTSLGNEYCPVGGNCIATPSWDQYGDYESSVQLENRVYRSSEVHPSQNLYIIYSNIAGGNSPAKVRCIRDE